MIEPNAKFLADDSVLRIKLAGKEWPVPALAIQQNAKVFPLIVRRLSVMDAVGKGAIEMDALTDEVIADFDSVVFWGLRRDHESLTRAEFDDMPITVLELPPAAIAVGIASGMFRARTSVQNGVDRPLELAAPNPPTG
jgi:hypothetical protein